MTKEEILAMEAGKELDKLIAEELFGLEVHPVSGVLVCHGTRAVVENLNTYSTDISAAWQVQEKMSQLAYDMSLLLHSTRTEPTLEMWLAPDWYCDFRPRGEVSPPEYEWVDHQKTAPEAICKAALIAKERR